MSMEKMMNGARKIIGQCMNVKAGEKVLIITDPEVSVDIARALFAAAVEKEAEAYVLYLQPPKNPGDDPGELAGLLMMECDVILTPTSKTLFHCPSIKKAVANGARLGTLSEADEEILMAGAIEADFEARLPMVMAVTEAYTNGSYIEMSTPAGTSIRAKIEGRTAISNTSLCHEPGDADGIPDIEVYIAPVEGTAEGTLVIDASSSAIGLMETPMKLTVEGGNVTKIEGGKEADKLRELLAKPGNPNCYNLAEMAVGLNPNARVRGRIIEDEAVYGTCHCAVGTNLNFGGTVAAPLHIDMVQWKPTIVIDGKMIFKDGECLL